MRNFSCRYLTIFNGLYECEYNENCRLWVSDSRFRLEVTVYGICLTDLEPQQGEVPNEHRPVVVLVQNTSDMATGIRHCATR